jgi:PAS domain S-box-containing protein
MAGDNLGGSAEKKRLLQTGLGWMAISGDPPHSGAARLNRETLASPLAVPRGLEKALLAAIVESSDDAIASKTLDGIVTSWNHAAERLYGYTADEIIGGQISILAAPGRENEMSNILERIRRGEHVAPFGAVRKRKDGSLVEVSVTVSPIRNGRGRIVGASKISRDITKMRQAEQQRELRFGELRHRAKNLLGMVGALARQTRAEGRSGEEYRDIFLGRFAALVAAHEAAFEEQDGTDLATLVARLLEPYPHASSNEAIAVEPGPPVSLPRGKVQPLAFVLHELATNAVKHGALSTAGGQLRVAWRVEQTSRGCYLHLSWQELGGPPVEPPITPGFGMKLIRVASAGELGGGAELTFAPRGLEAKITVRLS